MNSQSSLRKVCTEDERVIGRSSSKDTGRCRRPGFASGLERVEVEVELQVQVQVEVEVEIEIEIEVRAWGALCGRE